MDSKLLIESLKLNNESTQISRLLNQGITKKPIGPLTP